MTDHILHIGHTKIVITPRFGAHVLGVSELDHPVDRVGTFDSPVAASRFVEIFKRGLTGEGIKWDEWRAGDRARDVTTITAALNRARGDVARLQLELETAVDAERLASIASSVEIPGFEGTREALDALTIRSTSTERQSRSGQR